MTQHFTRNTRSVLHFCPTCNRKTMHRVDDRRLGSCLEHVASGLSKKQQEKQTKRDEEQAQPTLDFTVRAS